MAEISHFVRGGQCIPKLRVVGSIPIARSNQEATSTARSEIPGRALPENFRTICSVFVLPATSSILRNMDPLHATIEELCRCFFAAIRMTRLMGRYQLAPSHLDGTQYRATIGVSPLRGVRQPRFHSVKPWRLEDVLGKPLGRRG